MNSDLFVATSSERETERNQKTPMWSGLQWNYKLLKLRRADERTWHMHGSGASPAVSDLVSYPIIRNLLDSVFNIFVLQYSCIDEKAKDTYMGYFTAAPVALPLRATLQLLLSAWPRAGSRLLFWRHHNVTPASHPYLLLLLAPSALASS
jgi:hypothetical protein